MVRVGRLGFAAALSSFGWNDLSAARMSTVAICLAPMAVSAPYFALFDFRQNALDGIAA
jgi:hypothetical protein